MTRIRSSGRGSRGDDGGQRDGEDQHRQGDEDVGGAAEDGVDPAVAESGGEADEDAEEDLDGGGADADEQRDPGAVQEPDEQVAAGARFDAEPVVGARAAEGAVRDAAARRVDEVVVVRVRVLALQGGEQRRGEGEEDEQEQDGGGGEGGRAGAQPSPHLPGGARGGDPATGAGVSVRAVT